MINLLRKKNKPSTEPANNEAGGFKVFLHKVIFFVNVLTLVPLALAMLAWFVPPNVWYLPAVCALVTKQLLIIPVVWAALWLTQSVKFSVVNLAVLALNYNNLMNSYQMHQSKPPSKKDLKIISVNIDAFDYRPEKLEQFIAFLQKHKPDVICVQEFRDALGVGGKVRAIPIVQKELGLKNYAFFELMPTKNFGLAIFSKYPIVNARPVTEVSNDASNGVMFADIKMYGEVVRFFNVHLESYNFQRRLNDEPMPATEFSDGKTPFVLADYSPADVKKDKDKNKNKNNEPQPDNLNPNNEAPPAEEEKPKPKKKKKKTKNAAQQNYFEKLWDRIVVMDMTWPKQVEQADRYAQEVEKCAKPVVVCGDLNNPPYNYLYKTIRGPFQDCYQMRGNGWGNTYNLNNLPIDFRIDYTFASSHFQVIDYQTLDINKGDDRLTDHAAVFTRLRFNFHN